VTPHHYDVARIQLVQNTVLTISEHSRRSIPAWPLSYPESGHLRRALVAQNDDSSAANQTAFIQFSVALPDVRHRDRQQRGRRNRGVYVRRVGVDDVESANRCADRSWTYAVGRPRIAKAREALALLAFAAGICEGQGAGGQRPCDPATPLGPSHDLYCIELVAAPGVAAFRGASSCRVRPGPFTVAVTADGHSRFIPIGFFTGLPPTGTYIAWATTPQMDSLNPSSVQ